MSLYKQKTFSNIIFEHGKVSLQQYIPALVTVSLCALVKQAIVFHAGWQGPVCRAPDCSNAAVP